MRPLDPEQARGLLRVWRANPRPLPDILEMVTAKPGSEVFCEGCENWDYQMRNGKAFWRCYHPEFDDGTCPEGRWSC
jgi:hypothetical protein